MPNASAMKGSRSVQRAWKAHSQGNIEGAIALFKNALVKAPDDAYLNLQFGLLHLKLDRVAEAADLFERAISKEPKNPAPRFFCTLAMELADRHSEADKNLSELKALCPRHQGTESLQLLKELRRGDPLPCLERLGFAPLGNDDGRRTESLKTLAAGIGVGDPKWLPVDLSSSNYLLGPILLEVEQRLVAREIPELEHHTDDLVLELESSKKPKRDLRQELNAIHRSFQGGPKLRQGRRHLEKSLAIESLSDQKKGLSKAIALLRLGRRLDPFAFRTSFYLGEAYLFSAKTEPGEPYDRFSLKKAARYFLSSSRLDGINPYVLFYLALSEHLLGRPQTALVLYAKATKKFEKLPEAHYGVGQCHLLLGDRKLARENLLKAVNSDLAIARERLSLYATLLREHGREALERPLPALPPQAETIAPAEPDSSDEELAKDKDQKAVHERTNETSISDPAH